MNQDNKINYQPWCRREGNNRICLTCGKNIKNSPAGCKAPQHLASFRTKVRYNKNYWKRNKERLMLTNQLYRKSHPKHKDWARRYHKEWYARNRDRKLKQNHVWDQRNAAQRRPYLRKKALEWYHQNHFRARASHIRYYQKNKTRKNGRRNVLLKAQRARDPGARLRFNFRTRLSMLIRKKGPKRFSITRDVLLYTGEELMAHLEKQFVPPMCWENYATYWEVDHITECWKFDLANLEECKMCFQLSNLRPLKISENRGRYHHKRLK